jgi:hypothetical protein
LKALINIFLKNNDLKWTGKKYFEMQYFVGSSSIKSRRAFSCGTLADIKIRQPTIIEKVTNKKYNNLTRKKYGIQM